jgi:hypothetical protein
MMQQRRGCTIKFCNGGSLLLAMSLPLPRWHLPRFPAATAPSLPLLAAACHPSTTVGSRMSAMQSHERIAAIEGSPVENVRGHSTTFDIVLREVKGVFDKASHTGFDYFLI